MYIPFSPPKIYPELYEAVKKVIISGWLTTGNVTLEFEKMLKEYTSSKEVICLNSATAGLELALRFFGIGPGDEVILPAYTYCATANVVIHCGAKPIIVDVANDFNIDLGSISKAITNKSKVIIPVDFGGLPCDYDDIFEIVENKKHLFRSNNKIQESLGRILILSDAAHSLGAKYKNKASGSLADISVFSFHAVKNLTTAEGGAMCLNLSESFDNKHIYNFIKTISLHGQNKDAFTKFKGNSWKYDVIYPGYKMNMTDIQAALGVTELSRYNKETITKRKYVFERYSEILSKYSWAEIPLYKNSIKESSYHIFALRIKNISEKQRDKIINECIKNNVSLNVHFIPLPLLSAYKNLGYDIKNFPVSYDNYSREISLPVFYDITDEQIDYVCKVLVKAVENVIS